MIQQITPLPAPPQPSDSPIEFDQKSFALLGGLPQFVDQANALGGQIFTIGEDATESAAAALTSKNAAATSASNSADSASASSQSASNSASSANAANQSRINAQTASDTAQAIAEGMEDAIAFASTFTAVPATNQGPMVVVTKPHLRFMVWNGTKYVRAPWHAPGVLFFSHAPAASVTHGIQVRADVTYNTADQPDLAEMLGVVGPTFILPEGRARVLRAADNGSGIDTALVNGYLQEDAGRNLTGGYYMSDSPGSGAWGSTGAANGAFASLASVAGRANFQTVAGAVSPDYGLSLDASRQWPTASEFRVKSLTATLYITK